MDQPPKDLDEGLMKELECPVCFEYMKPPISMCQNGHSICNDCKQKLNNCPSCRKSFLNVRNLALESLSTVLMSPNKTPKNSESSHQNYRCPFATVSNEDCVWQGSLLDMKSHVKNSHSKGNDTHESTRQFNVILTNLSSERHYKKIVSIGDEIFYVVWEIKDGSFFCAVLYVGPKENSSKFTYTFSIKTENGVKKISMFFKVQSVVKNMDHVFTPGNCVLLHYDTVLKFLNSNKNLLCDFEISPVETVSDVEKKHSRSGRSNAVTRDTDWFTVKRGWAGKQTSQFESGFSGSYTENPSGVYFHTSWKDRGGRRGRGPVRGTFFRGGRHRVVDRSVESHGECDSKASDFQRRGNLLGKCSQKGRSMTDLRDEANYQAEMNIMHAIIQDTRLKVNSSSFLSPARNVPIDRHTNISGLDKSKDNVRENISKVKSSGSLSEKKVSNDKFTNVTVLEKSQDGIQETGLKVKSPTREKSVFKKSLNCVQADGPLVTPSSNLGTVKCAPSEKPNNIPELGESQDDFQAKVLKVSSPSSLTTSKYAFSDQVTNASESSKKRDEIQTIYPKLDFYHLTSVDDYYSSPFDALYDQAKANDAKANVRDARSLPSGDLLKDLFPTINQTDKPTPVSKENWMCSLCGYPAPLKQPKQSMTLFDFAPPGANRKCQLCGQWRP